MTTLRQRMLEDLQIRHYSPTTIRLYLYAIKEFARYFGKSPDQLGAEHIRRYQLFLTKEKKVSTSTYVLMVCALRFFYTHTLHRKVAIERIPFPRRERKLPLILSRDEVKAVLEAPLDLRHRAMLAILYAAGLRVSEVTRLKVADIDGARNVLWVRSGKGRKDRQGLLPPKLRELLRCYWRSRRPTDWLFPGARPSQPISVKVIFMACRKAGRAAGYGRTGNVNQASILLLIFQPDHFSSRPLTRAALSVLLGCDIARLSHMIPTQGRRADEEKGTNPRGGLPQDQYARHARPESQQLLPPSQER